ncbi:glycosyl hydrolase 108 family protein [Erwinia sp. 9145]|uniref:glycoside hydrolase family 108 protein n=1 Tax=Erwinia sp. 9145 TaxID=1500895 RepID=UPI000558D2CD|nr:glycosyl hydrolase 108 family protein [Erwinia sp. 9145]
MTRQEIFDGILGKEGGYVNNPNDKGGPTNWGITQAVARAHGYTGDMRNLTREKALIILEADYWYGPRFDQVAALSESIATELTDTGVNMGPAMAAKFLQRSLNVFNNQGKLYPDITADGQIGPRTIAALNAFLSGRKQAGETVMLKALNSLQGARYIELSETRAANEEFTYGWFERVTV